MRFPWSRTPADTLAVPFVKRLEDVEDRCERLERRFTKLQGEFNGYMRDRYLQDDYEEEDREDAQGRRIG